MTVDSKAELARTACNSVWHSLPEVVARNDAFVKFASEEAPDATFSVEGWNQVAALLVEFNEIYPIDHISPDEYWALHRHEYLP